MNSGQRHMVELCRRDRDFLLSGFCKLRKLDERIIPALVIDEIIQDILELDLVKESLSPDMLGFSNYEQRLVRINDNVDFSSCPNANREGIENFTKAHEIGHWRVFSHEKEIRAELGEGQKCLPLFEDKPPVMIVCRTPWSHHGKTANKNHRRREFEADMYARVFLVPEQQLYEIAYVKELSRLGMTGGCVSKKVIWRLIYLIAEHFHVSPTMMMNTLRDLGIVYVSEGRVLLSPQQNLDSIKSVQEV